jgi:transposase
MSATAPSWELPEVLWQAMEPLLPVLNAQRGRPRTVDLKRIAAGIFFVLRTGIQWHALPREQFGPASTVYYYFRQWEEAGVFEDVWAAALQAYDENVGLDWRWQSIDGCMTKAPLGGENDGAEPDRSSEVGNEAECAYGRRRDTHRHYGRWRQST